MLKKGDAIVVTDKSPLEGVYGVVVEYDSEYVSVLLKRDKGRRIFKIDEVKLVPKLGLLYRLLDFYI